MDLENLKARVYFLAGQLEEAKKMFSDAVKEVESANKKKEIVIPDVPKDAVIPQGD